VVIHGFTPQSYYTDHAVGIPPDSSDAASAAIGCLSYHALSEIEVSFYHPYRRNVYKLEDAKGGWRLASLSPAK
jgi:hypothetical protein